MQAQVPFPDALIAQEYLNLSSEEFSALIDRIQKVRGHVRIAVHPLFLSNPRNAYVPQYALERRAVEEFLERGFRRMAISTTRNSKTAPLFILEEIRAMPCTVEFLSVATGIHRNDFTRHGIILVPTENMDPRPTAREASLAYEKAYDVPPGETYDSLVRCWKDLESEKAEWDSEDPFFRNYSDQSRMIEIEVLDILDTIGQRQDAIRDSIWKGFGVASALVSGALVGVFRHKYKRLGCCAGTVAQSLRDMDRPTDLSRYIWNPRKWVSEEEIETKETRRIFTGAGL